MNDATLIRNLESVSKKDLFSFVTQYLRGQSKETWKDRTRQLFRCIAQSRVTELPIRKITATAPVFTTWFTDASKPWTSTILENNDTFQPPIDLELQTALCGSMEHVLSSVEATHVNPISIRRIDNMDRKHMNINVSESKEQMSYSEMKGLVNSLVREYSIEKEKRLKQAKKESSNPKPEKPNNLKRKLQESPEVLAIKVVKKQKRDQKKLDNPDAPARISRAQYTKEAIENKAKRQICFRLYPTQELESMLREWMDITDDIYNHCIDVYEDHLKRGYKMPPEDQLRQSIPLSDSGIKTAGLDHIEDYERRSLYTKLPINVQQEVIALFLANKKSADSNMKAGNNKGYDLTKRDKARRWWWISCTNRECSVTKDGQVRLKPSHIERVYNKIDPSLYIKDRLTRFISSKKATSHWGNAIKAGKDHGQGFTIRLDSSLRRWYLVLTYDALSYSGLFHPHFLEEALASPDFRRYRYIHRWVSRRKGIFDNEHCGTGNVASIDPGSRKPITFFDLQRQQFFCAYRDFNSKQERIYDKIAHVQSAMNSPTQTPESKKRSRKRPKKKKERKGRYSTKTMMARRALKLHTKAKAITTNAHNVLINALVSRYDTVVIPEFLTMGMVKKRRKKLNLPPVGSNNPDIDVQTNEDAPTPNEDRPIRKPFTLAKKTRVSLQRFAHFTFRQRLFAKALADPYRRKTILLTTEEYTTKQCPMCPFVHHTIGSKEVFDCPSCHFSGDRDCVGAFNVVLRSLTRREIAPCS